MPEVGRNGHVPVTVAQPTLTGHDTDGDGTADVAVLQRALVVRPAVAPCVRRARAVVDRALVALQAPPQRELRLHVTGATPALVVAVTQATGIDECIAAGHQADRA